MDNLIVVRHSPQWLCFDLEDSRNFCASSGLPPDTVLDFARAWDASLALTYKEFRQALKEIAWENFGAVNGATIIDSCDFTLETVTQDALVVFVDDDDWFAPDLFDVLRSMSGAAGFCWGSIRLAHRAIGAMARSHPDQIGSEALNYRPINKIIYTNNYAMRAPILKRDGLPQYFEHYSVQAAIDSGLYNPTLIHRYLSCANKHPACTVAAYDFLTAEEFQADPHETLLRAFAEIFDTTNEISDDEHRWIKKPLSRFRELLRATSASSRRSVSQGQL